MSIKILNKKVKKLNLILKIYVAINHY